MGTYSNLPTPYCTGYTFTGWYTDDGSLITNSTVLTTPSNHTLYAHWTQNVVPVTGVSLSKTSLSIKADDAETLTATVAPSDALDKTVTWGSSNTGVATVDGGIVTAVGAGTATITAKVGDKTATCAVTVSERQCQITQLTLIDASGQPLAVIPRGVFHVRAAGRSRRVLALHGFIAAGDSDGWRISFSVLYGNVLVQVSTKDISPEWLYQEIVSLR